MFDKKPESVTAGPSTGRPRKPRTALVPALVAAPPVSLSAAIRQEIAAVREPLHITHYPDGKNKTWVLAGGVPRVGVDAALVRRLAAHPQLTLAKATISSAGDLAFSMYLVTHPEDLTGELGAFIGEAVERVRQEAPGMPVPVGGPTVQVSARVEPAGETPLAAFFDALGETNYVRALNARRYYAGQGATQWGFEIHAVVTPTGERTADPGAFAGHFRAHLGAPDGWTVGARGYTGTFVDTLAGSPEAFGSPSARERE